MGIEWSDDYRVEMQGTHHKGGTPGKGRAIGPTAPFKGICNHCGKHKAVRHYPYNAIEPLGVYCKECFKEIGKAISEGGIAPREDDYD